jgi:hypothetical protein
MKRRAILALCVIGLVGGSVDAAFAGSDGKKNHQICVVLSDSSNYHQGQYLCVDSPDQIRP